MYKDRTIKKWFSQFGVEELDWPAQSPDLNPIQHLWDELDLELTGEECRPLEQHINEHAFRLRCLK